MTGVARKLKKGQNGDIRYITARHNVTSYGATVAMHRKIYQCSSMQTLAIIVSVENVNIISPSSCRLAFL